MSMNKDEKDSVAKLAEKVDFGKPKGHLDTQLFPGHDPQKKLREQREKEARSKKQ